ncbi:MAG: hypothetical protein P8X82_10305 [Gemmatimonadales bacterium]
MSSVGREYVQQVQKALSQYEEAIVRREHKKLLESKVSLRQDVDTARQKVLDVVVDLVTKERMKR